MRLLVEIGTPFGTLSISAYSFRAVGVVPGSLRYGITPNSSL
jgi:hypothetical protein